MGFLFRLLRCCLVLPITTFPVLAEEVTLPFSFDYGVVDQALAEQLFTGEQRSVVVYRDAIGCNSLTLENPRLDREGGLLGVQTTVSAQVGTPLGGRCMVPLSWQGEVKTLQEVFVAPSGKALAFRVVDSSVVAGESSSAVPAVVWEWVKTYIHPRLAAVTIDLAPALADLQGLVKEASSQNEMFDAGALGSVRVLDVHTASDKLHMNIAVQVPDVPPDWLPYQAEVFDEEELARWSEAWQAWDGYATWMIKTLALSGDRVLADALGDVLLEARYDLYKALVSDANSRDPVRELFAKTWERLIPVLNQQQSAIPGIDALQLATFISAADALRTLDAAAPHLGVTFDSATFRSLARLLMPSVGEADLAYNFDVDPALRSLLGFEPGFDEPAPEEPLLSWLIPHAMAAGVDPKLVEKLNGWVPKTNELDLYLETVSRLLTAIAAAEREKGKVPVGFYPVYEALMMATAWQESCWRQFVARKGAVEPIQSSAGSVGMMQVNRHVWRGIYDVNALQSNIGYNARAGNEILVHYLVDYAIKKQEHVASGNKDNLARAAYAAYNGGPGHLTRYRKPDNPSGLKQIDEAFWKKYQLIRSKGPAAVKSCYTGGSAH